MVASTSKAGIQPAPKPTLLITAVPRTLDKQWHIIHHFNLHSTKRHESSVAGPCYSAAYKTIVFPFFLLSDDVKAENLDVLFRQGNLSYVLL